MADAPKNPLDMSDEEISNMSRPEPVADIGEDPAAKIAREEAEAETARLAAEEAEKNEEGLSDAEKAARNSDDGDDSDPDDSSSGGEADDANADKDGEDKAPKLDADGKPIEEDKTPEEDKSDSDGSEPKTKAKDAKDSEQKLEVPDATALASFYNKIMTPFKANGKMIELKTPEEAVQLMQMGANYTRKLQDIQPQRKLLLMLKNNDLLDEGKLAFLIDLEKRNPEAIKKLVKDSGIDPLDIDAADTTAYRPGNHSVTDDEANFRTTMEELVSSDPKGKETVSEIYDNWDEASKEVLWKTPEIMTTIHEQRETGVYDLIKAEVDRQRTLGNIPANIPFLQAYQVVGDRMVEETLGENGKRVKQPEVKRDVLTTRAAAPKSKVANGEKAEAASSTRITSKAAKEVVNPLSMKDEDFLKQMDGRL